MRRMYDAAYPPASPPAWEVAAGYLGGDTPHAWTAPEWARQPARWRLPIWTRDNPGNAAQGAMEGAQAAGRARALGMPPTGCAIGLDYELAVDDAYLIAFDTVVRAAGYRTLLYGSLSTVFGNAAPSAGYWVAHYTGVAHLESGSVATQWADDQRLGTDYDASLVADSLVLWDTRPPAPPTPQENDMPQWLHIPLRDDQKATTILIPAGSAWSAYAHRSAHLGADGYRADAPPDTTPVVLRVEGRTDAPGTGYTPIGGGNVPDAHGKPTPGVYSLVTSNGQRLTLPVDGFTALSITRLSGNAAVAAALEVF